MEKLHCKTSGLWNFVLTSCLGLRENLPNLYAVLKLREKPRMGFGRGLGPGGEGGRKEVGILGSTGEARHALFTNPVRFLFGF